MRASGRLQLLLWRARVQLGKSATLREIVRRARNLRPDTRERHLRGEVEFWRRWMVSEGLSWPEDYQLRFDPHAPLQEHLVEILDRVPDDRLELLDVGAGPLTALGKVHPRKTFSITATDVLARVQRASRRARARAARSNHLRGTEKLRERLGDRQFDVVHARNTLDHSADPIEGIEQMLALTRPGGLIVLVHEENEGRKELYHALHKWDFTRENDHFVIAGPGPDGPRRDVTTMLAGRAEVECRLGGGNILVVIRKLDPKRDGTDA